MLDKVSDELLGHRRHRDGGGFLQHTPALPALEAPHQRRRRLIKNKLPGVGGGGGDGGRDEEYRTKNISRHFVARKFAAVAVVIIVVFSHCLTF